ncbi:MAG TPA: DUF4386 domain-containing protein [Puia sp.]|nr:DUF4386 domain-containing protein [Puia sp.]
MINPTVETSRQFYARLAGFTILFYMAAGATVVYLMNRATDAEGTVATLSRIAVHASDVRVAILLEILECFSALVLAVTLYGITRDENHELAMLALVCRVGEGVLGAIGIPRTMGLLWLANAGAAAGAPDVATTNAIGAFFLVPVQGALIGAPFFAVGSMIFSYLLLRGRIVPAALARLGMLASVLLVMGLPLQLAGFIKGPMTGYMWLPMIAYHVTLGLWLLIKGIPTLSRRQPA